MAWITPLTEPVERLVTLPQGRFVVTIGPTGITLRAYHRRIRAFVSYNEIAYQGLHDLLRRFTPKERLEPLKALAEICTTRLSRRSHKKKRTPPDHF